MMRKAADSFAARVFLFLTLTFSPHAYGGEPASAGGEPPKEVASRTGAARPDEAQEATRRRARVLNAMLQAEEAGTRRLALVNGEAITLADLRHALWPDVFEEPPAQTDSPLEAAMVLEALIKERLLAQRAREMGFDRLPGVEEERRLSVEVRLREKVMRELVKGVKVDSAAVAEACRGLAAGAQEPCTPLLRRRAEAKALAEAQATTLERYLSQRIRDEIVPREELLATLDFGQGIGAVNRFLEDRRPVTEVRGEEPVRVGDLAAAIHDLYYRTAAAATRPMNIAPREVLNNLCRKRVLQSAGREQGFDRAPEYLSAVRADEISLLSRIFTERVIQPAISLTGEDLLTTYHRHREAFVAPANIRLELTTFDSPEEALAALQKRGEGSERLFSPYQTLGPLPYDHLPAGLRQALAGAAEGDFRLYQSHPGGVCQVVRVTQWIPEHPLPFIQVRSEILKAAYQQKVLEAVSAWQSELRRKAAIRYLDDL